MEQQRSNSDGALMCGSFLLKGQKTGRSLISWYNGSTSKHHFSKGFDIKERTRFLYDWCRLPSSSFCIRLSQTAMSLWSRSTRFFCAPTNALRPVFCGWISASFFSCAESARRSFSRASAVPPSASFSNSALESPSGLKIKRISGVSGAGIRFKAAWQAFAPLRLHSQRIFPVGSLGPAM